MNDERGEETRIRQEIWRMGQENEEIRETKRIGRPERPKCGEKKDWIECIENREKKVSLGRATNVGNRMT